MSLPLATAEPAGAGTEKRAERAAPAPEESPLRPPTVPRTPFRLYAAQLFTSWSIAASNIFLGLAVLALPWSLRRRPVAWARLAPLTVPLGLYVLLLFASIAASYDPGVSVRSASETFNLAGLLLAALLVRGERDTRRLVDGLAAVGALLACAGLTQYLLGYGDLDRRIRGPFSHYMTFAGFLLICDLLLLAAVVCCPERRTLWRWAALAAVNVGLLGSYTRSAWVALAVAVTLLVLLRAPRLLLAYAPAALLFVVLAPTPLVARAASIFDLADTSNYDRLCMASAGATMIAERPLFGIGPEMVERRYALYRPPTAPRYQVPHLHDTFLQIAAERGLPALAAYLAMVGASLWVSWRRFRDEGGMSGPRADLYLGGLLALVAFNVAGLFENNWGDTEVQRAVLFVMALPFCLAADRKGVQTKEMP